MPITRTVISENYIKSNPCGSTRRTRISGDYIRPSYSYCGSSFWSWRPSFWRTRVVEPLVSEPTVIVGSARENSRLADLACLTVLVVGAIALGVSFPSCHTEEVCSGSFWGFGEEVCHLERVCHSFF